MHIRRSNRIRLQEKQKEIDALNDFYNLMLLNINKKYEDIEIINKDELDKVLKKKMINKKDELDKVLKKKMINKKRKLKSPEKNKKEHIQNISQISKKITTKKGPKISKDSVEIKKSITYSPIKKISNEEFQETENPSYPNKSSRNKCILFINIIMFITLILLIFNINMKTVHSYVQNLDPNVVYKHYDHIQYIIMKIENKIKNITEQILV
jgi:hypothetical protein